MTTNIKKNIFFKDIIILSSLIKNYDLMLKKLRY